MNVIMNEAGEVLKVEGNTCPRGEKYARQECTLPLRMITAVIPAENSSVPLSVKTAAPVPKRLIPEVMAAVKEIRAVPPVHIGQVLLSDVCGTGVDIVATRGLE